jgi:hypothetical protein
VHTTRQPLPRYHASSRMNCGTCSTVIHSSPPRRNQENCGRCSLHALAAKSRSEHQASGPQSSQLAMALQPLPTALPLPAPTL